MESYAVGEMIRRVEDAHLSPRYANPPAVAEVAGRPGSQKADTSRVKDIDNGGARLAAAPRGE